MPVINQLSYLILCSEGRAGFDLFEVPVQVFRTGEATVLVSGGTLAGLDIALRTYISLFFHTIVVRITPMGQLAMTKFDQNVRKVSVSPSLADR
jgi:hypothetical protein